MSYLSIDEVLRLKNPERTHVRKLDDALRDLLMRNLMAATVNKLDEDVVVQATMTLVLANAAREALALCERQQKPFNVHAFSKLARDVAAWVLSRRRETDQSKVNC